MKAFKTISEWSLAIMAILLALQIVNVSATYTMEQTCENIVKGFIADPKSCTGYGYCANGTLIERGNCPKGFIYNSDDGTCDYPDRFQCRVADVNSICQYRTDNEIFPDPNNCTRFCVCNNKKAECNHCPQYQIFDSSKRECVWSDETLLNTTCMDNSICRLIQDKEFAGDPEKCGNFILCREGVGESRKCGNDLKYNKKTGYCEKEDPCTDSPNDGAAEGNGVGAGITYPIKDLPENNNICKNFDTTKTEPQFFSDGKTCFGYFVCTSKDSKAIWGKCPLNTHFNEGQCVTPYTYACPYDRCGNLNQTFVGAIDSDCKKYLYCKDQVSQGGSLLSETNPKYPGIECQKDEYFNEVEGVCQKHELSYKDSELCTKQSTPSPNTN